MKPRSRKRGRNGRRNWRNSKRKFPPNEWILAILWRFDSTSPVPDERSVVDSHQRFEEAPANQGRAEEGLALLPTAGQTGASLAAAPVSARLPTGSSPANSP